MRPGRRPTPSGSAQSGVTSGARARAARRMSVAWGRSSDKGRLRCTRTPRSTWAMVPTPKTGGHVDQQGQLDGVAVGQPALLQHRPGRGRLAGQRLLDGGQVGEEQIDDRLGHQLGDPPAAVGGSVERAPIEPLDQGDRLVDQQRPEQSGHEVGPEVGHVGVDEDDEVAFGGLEAGAHGLPLPPVGGVGADDPGPGLPGHARRSGRRSRRRPPRPRRPAGRRRRARSGPRRSNGPPGRRWPPRCGPGCTPRCAGPPLASASTTGSNWACEYRLRSSPGADVRSACRHHRSPWPIVWTQTVLRGRAMGTCRDGARSRGGGPH